jgi:penicillin amidase
MIEPQVTTPSPAPAPRRVRRRGWLRVLGKVVLGLAALLVLAIAGAALWIRGRLVESLPQLTGERQVSGLAAAVRVERDATGVPSLWGSSRADVAFATGFVHAQDRFFQMDLLRRRSAGELSALFGERALEADRATRIHLFSRRARAVVAAASPEVRAVLASYAAGVDAGLRSLGERPFEYLLLRAAPEPWRPEDSILVLLTMFLQLQDEEATVESAASTMRDLLPAPLVDFLLPRGTEWDAPLQGGAFAAPPIPGPETFTLRAPRAAAASPPGGSVAEPERVLAAASNAWAVAGSHTADGGALLADELHLGLTLPNLWYRVSLSWPAEGGGRWRVVGVTLPGLPIIVVGSNGRVAWGVTNSAVDTSDVVLLESSPGQGAAYRVPGGVEPFRVHRETLRVKGGGARTLDVHWTRWGPLIGRDHAGRRRALRWVAHEPQAVDLDMLRLETARNVDEALDVANRSGVPAINLLVADATGRVGWTILGRLPRRLGFDGRTAGVWADGRRRWDGLLPPSEVPRIADPPAGRLWIANSRTVGGEELARLGDGGYLLGARARQIRDALLASRRVRPEDMLRLQLDDRALFLQRWRDLLLAALSPQAVADPRRRELRNLVEAWGGRAAVDSAGYLLVRTFRVVLAKRLFEPLTAACTRAAPGFDYLQTFGQAEGPLWRLVTERPGHLLPPGSRSWSDEIMAAVDETLDLHTEDGHPLSASTWGKRNTVRVRHPVSPGLPGFGRWLDMPPLELPGDEHMPRVQHPDYGATLRMVVSPGREAEGIFHMPGGESGHPLSRHYRDGHAAWARGEATPFLPGPAAHVLRLTPSPAKGLLHGPRSRG